MSSNIWTRCAGTSEVRALRLTPWRAVEAQHQISTRKLVDTMDEQVLLEQLIDGAKPPDITGGALHYLLATPFRYPPLRHGSRFGTRFERGIWYGAEKPRTVFAEVAYYRFIFFQGSHADLGAVSTALTLFTVHASSEGGVDLVAPPFDAFARVIASATSYAATQVLGGAMREAGVELFRFPSARDRDGGACVGVFSPAAFGHTKPRHLETWHCVASHSRVELTKRDYFGRETHAFLRDDFLVNDALPSPAV